MDWISAVFVVVFVSSCSGYSFGQPKTYEENVILHQSGITSDVYNKFKQKMVNYVSQQGYHLEEHRIETSDEYVLTLYHLERRESRASYPDARKQPVLLQHGALSSSADFLVPRTTGLAYVLIEAGYDVWLANNRGSIYSTLPGKFNPYNDQRYWNFRMSAFAQYDLPAALEAVSRLTGVPRVVVLGHSYGVHQALDVAPAARRRVAAVVGLAPAGFQGTQAVCSESAMILRTIVAQLDRICDGREKSGFKSLYIELGHHDWRFCQPSCHIVWQTIRGSASEATWRELLDLVYFSTSTNVIREISDSIINGNPISLNQDVYNNPDKFPVHIFYSHSDIVVSAEDVLKILEIYPESKLTPVTAKNFNHMDFLWGPQANEILFIKIVDVLRYYDQKNNVTDKNHDRHAVEGQSSPRPEISNCIEHYIRECKNNLENHFYTNKTSLRTSRDALLVNILESSNIFKHIYDLNLSNSDLDEDLYYKIKKLVGFLKKYHQNCVECRKLLWIITGNLWYRDYSSTEKPTILHEEEHPFPIDNPRQPLLSEIIKYKDILPSVYDLNFSNTDSEEVFFHKLLKLMNDLVNCPVHSQACDQLLSIIKTNTWFINYDINKISLGEFGTNTRQELVQQIAQYRDAIGSVYDFHITTRDPEEVLFFKLIHLLKDLIFCPKRGECQKLIQIIKRNNWFINFAWKGNAGEQVTPINALNGPQPLEYKSELYQTLRDSLSRINNLIKTICEVTINKYDDESTLFSKVYVIWTSIAKLEYCNKDCTTVLEIIRNNDWFIKRLKDGKADRNQGKDYKLDSKIKQLRELQRRIIERMGIKLIWDAYDLNNFGKYDENIVSIDEYDAAGFKNLLQEILNRINVLNHQHVRIYENMNLKTFITQLIFIDLLSEHPGCKVPCQNLVYIINNNQWVRKRVNKGYLIKTIFENVMGKDLTGDTLAHLHNNIQLNDHSNSYQSVLKLLLENKQYIKDNFNLLIHTNETRLSLIKKLFLITSLIKKSKFSDLTSMNIVTSLKGNPWLEHEVRIILEKIMHGNRKINVEDFLKKSFERLVFVLSRHFRKTKNAFGIGLTEFDKGNNAYKKVFYILGQIDQQGSECLRDCSKIRYLIENSYWYKMIYSKLRPIRHHVDTALNNHLNHVRINQTRIQDIYGIYPTPERPTQGTGVKDPFYPYQEAYPKPGKPFNEVVIFGEHGNPGYPYGNKGAKNRHAIFQRLFDKFGIIIGSGVKVEDYEESEFKKLLREMSNYHEALNKPRISFYKNETLKSVIIKLIIAETYKYDSACKQCSALVNLIRRNKWHRDHITVGSLIKVIQNVIFQNEFKPYNDKCESDIIKDNYEELCHFMTRYNNFLKSKFNIEFTQKETYSTFLKKLFVVFSLEEEGAQSDGVLREIKKHLACSKWFIEHVINVSRRGNRVKPNFVTHPNKIPDLFQQIENATNDKQFNELLREIQRLLVYLSSYNNGLDSSKDMRYFITELLSAEMLADRYECGTICLIVVDSIRHNQWYQKFITKEYLLKDILDVLSNTKLKGKFYENKYKSREFTDILKLFLNQKEYLRNVFNILVDRSDNEEKIIKRIYIIISKAARSNVKCDSTCNFIIESLLNNQWLQGEMNLLMQPESTYEHERGLDDGSDSFSKLKTFLLTYDQYIMQYFYIRISKNDNEDGLYSKIIEILKEIDKQRVCVGECELIRNFCRNNLWFKNKTTKKPDLPTSNDIDDIVSGITEFLDGAAAKYDVNLVTRA